MVEAAKKEGKVVVYAGLDTKSAIQLIEGFEDAYGIQVEYVDSGSTELFTRFISEVAAGAESADVMMPGGGDLASRLVEQGFAAEYKSPEAEHVPAKFIWDNKAFGYTNEPIVILYNKNIVPKDDVPATNEEFTTLLRDKHEAYAGKVATYDPQRSGSGFLYFKGMTLISDRAWTLIEALGDAETKLYTSSGTMMERIRSGELSFAYHMVGAYADAAIKAGDQTMGFVVPCDYSLALVRTAVLPKAAPRPNAARLFVDYLISVEGQKKLAEASNTPVREDALPENSVMPKGECAANMSPLVPSAETVKLFSDEQRAEFLTEWKARF
jgi:iron(III) transport system substrate-binding protein